MLGSAAVKNDKHWASPLCMQIESLDGRVRNCNSEACLDSLKLQDTHQPGNKMGPQMTFDS